MGETQSSLGSGGEEEEYESAWQPSSAFSCGSNVENGCYFSYACFTEPGAQGSFTVEHATIKVVDDDGTVVSFPAEAAADEPPKAVDIAVTADEPPAKWPND